MSHILFWRQTGENGYLSNWFDAPFSDEDTKYQNTEQYMMAKKAELFKDDVVLNKIMKSSNSRQIRDLGRTIKNFDQSTWDKNKEKIMIDGLLLKFSQNADLGKLLLETGDKILVEASPFDKIWGTGCDADTIVKNKYKWSGQNLLGKCLMIVRDEKLKKI
jgi:ribA/ribD-fused uncharacterized protein